jgi:hypothetical protein
MRPLGDKRGIAAEPAHHQFIICRFVIRTALSPAAPRSSFGLAAYHLYSVAARQSPPPRIATPASRPVAEVAPWHSCTRRFLTVEWKRERLSQNAAASCPRQVCIIL